MMGLSRLGHLLRPSLDKVAVLSMRPRSPGGTEQALSHQLRIIERATARLAAEKSDAGAELHASVQRFRTAFESGASSQKTLARAWQVQRAWNKLRNVEASLLILSKEHELLASIVSNRVSLPRPAPRERPPVARA